MEEYDNLKNSFKSTIGANKDKYHTLTKFFITLKF